MMCKTAVLVNLLALGSTLSAQPAAASPQSDTSVDSRRYITQVVDGGGWKTTITFTNGDSHQNTVSLQFFDDTGIPLVLQFRLYGNIQTGSSAVLNVSSLGSTVLETVGYDPTVRQGYAVANFSDPNSLSMVSLSATLSRVSSAGVLEASVLGVGATFKRCTMPFDNSAGITTGLALANPDTAPGDFIVRINDEAGSRLMVQLVSIKPGAHTTWSLADSFPESVGRRGYIDVTRVMSSTTPYPMLAMMGLRFSPSGSFSALPVACYPQ
jgi:hypothetical protein